MHHLTATALYFGFRLMSVAVVAWIAIWGVTHLYGRAAERAELCASGVVSAGFDRITGYIEHCD